MSKEMGGASAAAKCDVFYKHGWKKGIYNFEW